MSCTYVPVPTRLVDETAQLLYNVVVRFAAARNQDCFGVQDAAGVDQRLAAYMSKSTSGKAGFERL